MHRYALRSLSFLVIVAGVGFAVTPFPAAVQGGTRMVDSLADHGPGSLRQALADSLDGDRIEIAVDGTIALESTLEISRSVTVLGPEIVEGQEPRIRLDGGGKVSVLHVAKGVTVTLEGLIVERGWTDDRRTGGGITNEGSLDMQRCWIRGNEAEYGGGVHNAGQLNLDESHVVDNMAGVGGGMYSTPGDVRVANSVVARNQARSSGGGLYTGRSSHEMLVEKSRIEGNVSLSDGAGIVGSGWIVDSVIVGNLAGRGGYGGGVTIGFGGILRSAVIDNRAHVGAGVLSGTQSVLSGGDLVIADTTIAANVATSGGGGIEVRDRVRIVNSTIAENSAVGGVGGGIEVGGDGGAALLFNTLLSDNQGGNCNEPVDQIGHNIQHPGTDCGAAIASADPLLGPLDRDHPSPALEPGLGSPAIDAGNLRACGSEPVSGVDQRGMARPTGGQAGCDIGAVEAGSMHTPTPGYTPAPAATQPPDLVSGAYGYYIPASRGTCHGKWVDGGASVEVENRGPSPAGPFMVEFGGVRQEVERLGARSSTWLTYPWHWGRWLIADVEESVSEWFEGNNVVDNVSLIYLVRNLDQPLPTQGPTTPATPGPSPTPVPTPVVTGRVALQTLDDPSSCAQPLGVRAAFTATSGLGSVTDMRVRLDPYKSCCEPDTIVEELAWQPFEPYRDYAIEGGPKVFLASLTVQFRDDAGHLSPVTCETVVRPCEPGATPAPRSSATATPSPSPSSTPGTPRTTATPTSTGPLPDLGLTDGFVCGELWGPQYLEIWVLNLGPVDAGAFSVRDTKRPGLGPATWRVAGLAGHARARLDRQPVLGPIVRVRVDADDEVAESNETNNEWISVHIPPGVTATLPLPPTCEPSPTATATVTATATARGARTPTQMPRLKVYLPAANTSGG